MKTVEIRSIFKESYAWNEAYKTLRTNLLFCGKEIKVITVTSCVAAEGKSSVVMELCKNLAAGKKVLMLDMDLRRSTTVTKYTDEKGILGLSQYFSGQCAWDDIVYATQYEGFHIAFAGQYPPNPVDLISSDACRELIAKKREEYDYVILDTPPLGLVIDAAVTCDLSDGAILVISADRISYRFAEEVKEQIEKSDCRLLGAILNEMDSDRSSYYYYRYSYRYYGRKYYGKYGKYAKYAKYAKYGKYAGKYGSNYYSRYGYTSHVNSNAASAAAEKKTEEKK